MSVAWDDFRLVRAIAELGGLTRAAAHLGINHSTAFRRLSAIEAAVETRLFERLRTGYVATPAGLAMAAAAERMEDEVAGVLRAVAGQAAAPAGNLRVTAAASFVSGALMPVFAAFRARHSGVTLDVVAAQEALNLSRRDADVAVRASLTAPPNLVARRVACIAWALYGRVEDGTDTADRDWVTPDESVGGGVFARFTDSRIGRGRVAMRLNSVHGLAEAVAAGIGIAALPCIEGDRDPTLMRLGQPEPELETNLWLLTHPDLRNAPRVRAFLDFCAERLAALRPLIEGRAERSP